MKIISRILLAVIIITLLSLMPALAGAYDMIINGDFEKTTGGILSNWELSGGAALAIPPRPPVPGQGELIMNGGFENRQLVTPIPPVYKAKDWTAYWNNWNGTSVQMSSSVKHSGSYSVRVSGFGADNFCVTHRVNGIVPGAEYQLSAWGYLDAAAVDGGGNAVLSYFKEDAGSYLLINGESPRIEGIVNPQIWTQIIYNFTAPAECAALDLGLYVYNSSGYVYFDDVSLHMIDTPDMFELETEDIFHYSDNTTGTAEVRLNNYYNGVNQSEIKVDFKLLDNETVIAQQLNTSMSAFAARYIYGLAAMELKKEYIVTATIKYNGGEDYFSQRIYKYPRPSKLTREGVYMDNGEPFMPVIAYWPGDYTRLPEINVNVAEIGAFSVEHTLTELDKLQALGLKALVSVYLNPAGAYGCPSGHPANAAYTKELIKMIKDHDAVFAYAVCDEPFGSATSNMDEWLLDSYRLIRDIDEVHPIYLLEVSSKDYKKAGKMTDIFAVDPYPFSSNSERVTMEMKKARAAVNSRKPVYAILQTFDNGGWFPTTDNVREQIYRALAEGAKGIGYFTIDNATNLTDGDALYATDRWNPMIQFSNFELIQALEYFTLAKYPTFNKYDEGSSTGFYYASWVMGGKIYLAAHNRSSDTINRMIPLISSNGKVALNEYTIRKISKGEQAGTAGTGGLNVSLAAQEVIFYEITPSNPIGPGMLSVSENNANTAFATLSELTDAGVAEPIMNTMSASVPEYNYVNLPIIGSKVTQRVVGLKPMTSYVLTVLVKSSVANSAELRITYGIKEDSELFKWTDWCANNGVEYITAEGSYSEGFGVADGGEWHKVMFEITTPKDTNALELSLSSRLSDAVLCIDNLALMEAEEYNLIKNGDFTYFKNENILTGGWSRYDAYLSRGNKMEFPVYDDNPDNRYICMSELPPNGVAGWSANASQPVALYKGIVYKLTFKYKNPTGTNGPFICLYNSTTSTNGHIITSWDNVIPGVWGEYTVHFTPASTGIHSIWVGGVNARGEYCFDDVHLVPVGNNESKVVFYDGLPAAKSGNGCMEYIFAENIYDLSDARVVDGKRSIAVVNKFREGSMYVAAYSNLEMVDFAATDGSYLSVSLPESPDYEVKVFLWDQLMRPLSNVSIIK